jgi:hypothetical protein
MFAISGEPFLSCLLHCGDCRVCVDCLSSTSVLGGVCGLRLRRRLRVLNNTTPARVLPAREHVPDDGNAGLGIILSDHLLDHSGRWREVVAGPEIAEPLDELVGASTGWGCTDTPTAPKPFYPARAFLQEPWVVIALVRVGGGLRRAFGSLVPFGFPGRAVLPILADRPGVQIVEQVNPCAGGREDFDGRLTCYPPTWKAWERVKLSPARMPPSTPLIRATHLVRSSRRSSVPPSYPRLLQHSTRQRGCSGVEDAVS